MEKCAKCGKTRIDAFRERGDGLEEWYPYMFDNMENVHEWYALCAQCQKIFKPRILQLEKIHSKNIEKSFLGYIEKEGLTF